MKNCSIMKTAFTATVFIAIFLLLGLTAAASGVAGRELAGRPVIYRSLNSLEARLDPRHFFRSSRKHIINLAKVERIESWFSSNHQIEMSRWQGQKFRELRSQ